MERLAIEEKKTKEVIPEKEVKEDRTVQVLRALANWENFFESPELL